MDFFTLLIVAIIGYFVVKAFKKNGSNNQESSRTKSVNAQTKPTPSSLVDSINRLREERLKQEGAKNQKLETDVQNKRSIINGYNSEADKMGLRKSLCYIVDETEHWHAWKSNTPNFEEKYTNIDDFTFQDARQMKVGDRESRTEVDFIFNQKKFQIAYQSRGSYDATNFGLIEIFEETNGVLEKMLVMETYMSYSNYDVKQYSPGDISLYKIGEWIPMTVSVEAGLQAISKRVSLEFAKDSLDKKFVSN